MLHFYTAGESHGQALLAFLSGLPAGHGVLKVWINRKTTLERPVGTLAQGRFGVLAS